MPRAILGTHATGLSAPTLHLIRHPAFKKQHNLLAAWYKNLGDCFVDRYKGYCSIRCSLTVGCSKEITLPYLNDCLFHYVIIREHNVERDSSVGIATRYRPDSPGNESRLR